MRLAPLRRLLAAALVASVLPAGLSAATAQEAPTTTGPDDVTVVAVVDGSFSPYHYDFLASRMPQARNADPTDDLPLDQPPHTWLPGFPEPSAFASYDSVDVTLPTSAGQTTASLTQKDAAEWSGMRQSTAAEAHYRWLPGTKVVGALRYGNGPLQADNAAHGAGTSAVSVGTQHGTCPECVVVLVTYGGGDREAATDWAMRQPWIDVVTHSYGYSTTLFDKVYNGSDLALQKSATERGQAVFWSASNGQLNAFDAPTTTLFSSSKGPDWLITVGATSPKGGNFTGSGKTVDLASIGTDYPSLGGPTVNGNGTFSGTSNATPVVAGMYARQLYRARRLLEGPSRTQDGGAVATGAPVVCGSVRPDCELGDGVLTRDELQDRLFLGAQRTPQGPEVSITGVVAPVAPEEYDLASEGYGTYFARVKDAASWRAEEERVFGPMVGTAPVLQRAKAETDWMLVDSYCRQEVWGSWEGGAYVAGKTALPAASADAPVRSAYAATCPSYPQPPRELY